MLPIYLMNFLFAVSTTIGMTFIPLLITDKLGMSLFVLGIIEGGTEFISNILRLITGNIFDRVKNRRLLFVIPSTLALLSKLILFVPTAWTILIAKITERAANGAFASPRDAYVGEHAKNKGIALGYLSTSKTFGCVIGPLIVGGYSLLVGSLQENIFLIIVIACLINLAGFILSFKVNTERKLKMKVTEKFNLSELKGLFKNLRLIFILSFLFFLGRFNDGMIMIYLKNEGFPEWFYLTTIAFFNVIMLLVSAPMGFMVDKKREYQVMFLTIIALLSFNILFVNLHISPWPFACCGIVCWGVQRAGAQITFSAMIFKQTPIKYYGTAIGAFSLLSGCGVFIASLIGGYLAHMSFYYVFYLSGMFSSCALILAFIATRSEQRKRSFF